jgi:sensor histidine kinase YesM
MNFIFIFNFPLQFGILGYTLVYFFLDLIHILLIAIFYFGFICIIDFFFNFILQQMICKELGFVIFLDEVLLV